MSRKRHLMFTHLLINSKLQVYQFPVQRYHCSRQSLMLVTSRVLAMTGDSVTQIKSSLLHGHCYLKVVEFLVLIIDHFETETTICFTDFVRLSKWPII